MWFPRLILEDRPASSRWRAAYMLRKLNKYLFINDLMRDVGRFLLDDESRRMGFNRRNQLRHQVQDHYLTDQTYKPLLAALPHVKPDPITGQLEPHCFAETLGEIGGIWPESVLRDQMREAVEEAA